MEWASLERRCPSQDRQTDISKVIASFTQAITLDCEYLMGWKLMPLEHKFSTDGYVNQINQANPGKEPVQENL